MLKCKDVVQMASEHSERPNTLSARMGLWFHLLMCKYCRRFVRQLQNMRTMLKQRPTPCHDDDIADDLWSRRHITTDRES